jgi:poly-gamma-glutamate capsule biosynthesis protein CapA/YwtB (metallophosphatase superfamily)
VNPLATLGRKEIPMSDVKMLLVGDTNVGRPDPDSAFASTLHLLRDADIKFCNLETVVADAKYLHPYDRSHLPRTEEWMFQAYLRAGFNVMNQANNPNTYHGHEPLLRSFEVLDAVGVVHAGAGRNLAEARKPAVIERNGTKVAFVCRTSVGTPEMAATVDTPGVAFYPVQTLYEPSARVHSNPGLPPIVHTVPDRGAYRSALAEDIRAAREQADVVIVSWHWGLSPYQVHPNAGAGEVEVMEYQQEMGHFAIDSGADMVIGHHSHQPQPIEVYKGKPILYSLANFVHDLGGFRERTLMAMLVHCLISDGKIQRLSYVPGIIRGHGPPDFARPSQVAEVVKCISEMSSPFGTQFEVGEEEVTLVLGTAP